MWGVQDLVVWFGGRRAVSGVSFGVRPGEVCAIVGGDGAGKTTVLRSLAGLLPAGYGTVASPPSEEIGYVSSGPGVYRDLTVAENLRFCGRAYGMDRSDLEGRMEELLARTDLLAARDRPAGKLSGGMRQKLALAAALLHRPRLLILDEPTTGVDPVSRAELWRLIHGAAAGGAAVVLATSYVDEAERAGEVIVLVDGEVLVSGSPEDITASVQGELFTFGDRPQAWRRGASWRVWWPEPVDIEEAQTTPDLEDAVVIGELLRLKTTQKPKKVKA